MSDFDGFTRRRALTLASAAFGAHFMPAGAFGSARPRARAFTLDLRGGEAAAGAAGWRVLRPVRSPRMFHLIGVSSGARCQVRVRRRRGTWSAWRPLLDHPDHAPDGETSPRYTDPVWTGGADELQLRVHGAAPTRAALVSVEPAQPRARVAQAFSDVPSIVARDAWGAAEVPPRDAPSYGSVELAFVHHTVSASDYEASESAGIVLAIAKFHRNHNGWDDIGYNLLVDRFGQVFEGRAGGVDQAVVGAQTQGWNSVSTGIACIGTFSDDPLPEPAVKALSRTLAWKLSVHGVPVDGHVEVTSAGGSSNRYAKGETVSFDRISGHTHANSTACPGAALLAQLPEIRARAAAAPVAPLTAAAPPLELRAAARRVRTTGPGVLLRGRAGPRAPVTIEVARKRSGGRYGRPKTLSLRAARGGLFSRRVKLTRPGLYRLRARSGDEIADVYVRSIRSRANGGHAA